MTAYRKFLAFAVILTATSAASAQATSDGEGRAAPAASAASADSAPVENGEWRTYPSEHHLLLSVSGGPGLRLLDAWHSGILGPWWTLIQVRSLITNFGNLRVGASLGAQLGFDSHAGLQWAIQPGIFGMYRTSPNLGITFRVDVPFLFTRGPDALTGDLGMGVRAPDGRTTAVAIGVEAGVGAAYYLTSGIAVTAEINGGAYGADTYIYPTLGLGLGVLIDYELLP